MFLKELDKPENIIKCFHIVQHSFQNSGTTWEQHWTAERGSKDKSKTLPSLYSISLDKGSRQCGFATEVFSEQRGKQTYDNQASKYTCKGLVL